MSLYILISVDAIQLISIILVLILLFLGYKIFETKWSYKISKPYNWENSVNSKQISDRLKNIEGIYRDKVRFYNLWFQVERLKKNNIPGAFAELGVYKGETAEMLNEMDDSRKLYLFDTFTGFDKNDLQSESKPDAKYNEENFSDTSLEAVKKIFADKANVLFYPGFFPQTADGLKEENFALVHLDADLYQPTITGLRYFYTRLNPGGVIIIHDYNHNWNGVTKAVDEFVLTIPESLVELSDWQGSVMIFRNK